VTSLKQASLKNSSSVGNKEDGVTKQSENVRPTDFMSACQEVYNTPSTPVPGPRCKEYRSNAPIG